MNVLEYAAIEERMWENMLADMGNYKRQTTFYSDLSIAEWYNIGSIKETYKNVVDSWLSDVIYFTEFIMCLNHKSWEWYYRAKKESENIVLSAEEYNTQQKLVEKYQQISQLYAELYEKSKNLAYQKFDEKGVSYLYATLD